MRFRVSLVCLSSCDCIIHDVPPEIMNKPAILYELFLNRARRWELCEQPGFS